jgi:hypothetical protein
LRVIKAIYKLGQVITFSGRKNTEVAKNVFFVISPQDDTKQKKKRKEAKKNYC